MISLLSADGVNELLYSKLILSAVNTERLDWTFGSADNIKVFRSFMYMQSLMRSRSIDPRIHNELSDEINKNKAKNKTSK